MEPENNPFTEVFRARTSAQAHMVKNALENEDIAAILENDILQGVIGDVPMGWATFPRILVAPDRADAAREIIKQIEEAQQTREDEAEADDTPYCLSCGSVFPESADRCPMCGWSYEGEDGEKAERP